MLGRRLEQLRDGGDLLTEVERTPPLQLHLVCAVDRCDLAPAHDLQGGAIGDVRGCQLVDAVQLLRREVLPLHELAAPAHGSPGGLLGDVLDIGRVVLDLLAQLLCPLVAAQPGIRAAHVPDRSQVALDEEARGGIRVAAVSVLEDLALSGDEGVEVVRRDELVLGAIDEPNQVAIRPLPRVVDERQLWADLPQHQELTDAVQHIRPCRQAHLRAGFGQHPMAEAVEVGDGEAGGGRGAHRCFDALAQLAGGLDVVGQDQEVLGEEVFVRGQEVADALDDDPGLARAGAGDDDQRPIAVLDDGALLGGQRGALSGAGGCLCRCLCCGDLKVLPCSPRSANDAPATSVPA